MTAFFTIVCRFFDVQGLLPRFMSNRRSSIFNWNNCKYCERCCFNHGWPKIAPKTHGESLVFNLEYRHLHAQCVFALSNHNINCILLLDTSFLHFFIFSPRPFHVISFLRNLKLTNKSLLNLPAGRPRPSSGRAPFRPTDRRTDVCSVYAFVVSALTPLHCLPLQPSALSCHFVPLQP